MKAELVGGEAVKTCDAMDDTTAPVKNGPLLMRSKEDELGVWESLKRHKTMGMIAMLAAFCASLDGYRKHLVSVECRHQFHVDADLFSQKST